MLFSGILHANVGSEVGAMITQSWIESFMAEYDATDLTDEIENTKILENYLYFACCLYAFHVYGHDLIFNIFTKFAQEGLLSPTKKFIKRQLSSQYILYLRYFTGFVRGKSMSIPW